MQVQDGVIRQTVPRLPPKHQQFVRKAGRTVWVSALPRQDRECGSRFARMSIGALVALRRVEPVRLGGDRTLSGALVYSFGLGGLC